MSLIASFTGEGAIPVEDRSSVCSLPTTCAHTSAGSAVSVFRVVDKPSGFLRRRRTLLHVACGFACSCSSDERNPLLTSAFPLGVTTSSNAANPPAPDGGVDADRVTRVAINLAAAYAELQRLLLDAVEVKQLLDEVARLAADTLSTPATPVSCGITLRQGEETHTVASSDDFALQVDEIQYSNGQGPCLQALHDQHVVSVEDMSRETRWPAYVARALTFGVGSSLSLPLHGERGLDAALNLYASRPGAFTSGLQATAEALAEQAGGALRLAVRHAGQVQLSEQLQEALASRAVIDQALGIIMAQQRCTSDAAFAILRAASQTRNRKLREMAADLIATVTGNDPGSPAPSSRR